MSGFENLKCTFHSEHWPTVGEQVIKCHKCVEHLAPWSFRAKIVTGVGFLHKKGAHAIVFQRMNVGFGYGEFTLVILAAGIWLNVLRRLARIPGGGSNTKALPALSKFTGSLGFISIVRKSRNAGAGCRLQTARKYTKSWYVFTHISNLQKMVVIGRALIHSERWAKPGTVDREQKKEVVSTFSSKDCWWRAYNEELSSQQLATGNPFSRQSETISSKHQTEEQIQVMSLSTGRITYLTCHIEVLWHSMINVQWWRWWRRGSVGLGWAYLCSFFSSWTSHCGARWTFFSITQRPDLMAELIALSAWLNPSAEPEMNRIPQWVTLENELDVTFLRWVDASSVGEHNQPLNTQTKINPLMYL